MKPTKKISRRTAITLGATGLAAIASQGMVQPAMASSEPQQQQTDGTPAQFFPKNGPDTSPHLDDVEKYPQCPYCGMSREKWSHTRHLIHYSDDLVDPVCSLHCAAIGLSLNLDRHTKAIYVGDAGSPEDIKPLIPVEQAQYLIGSDQPGTMTKRSKWAYSSLETLQDAQQQHGGEQGTFEEALTAAYLDMAADTLMIRKRREEKRMKR